MPNIRSQTVHNDGGSLALTIVASDGRSITLTKSQIQTFYQGTTGSAASRRSQVITFIRNSIITALGAEQVTAGDLTFDFDTGTGSITTATIGLVN